MNEKQAFQIISQGLQIANKAGVFNLQDSAQVFAALSVLDRIHGEEPVDPSKASGEVVQMKAVKEAAKPKTKK